MSAEEADVAGRIEPTGEAPCDRVQVSARISATREEGWPARVVWLARSGPYAEAFRQLAVRVRGALSREPSSSLLITSALPEEGKTLTACNLALALASLTATERVALVDLDLRVPGVAKSLGLEPACGIAEVLRGDVRLQSAVLVTDAGLDVYPVLKPCPAPHRLLAQPEMADLLKSLEARYRYVICDAPPVLPVPDVQLLAPHVGACLAVIRAGRTPRSVLRELAERLPREKTLGFFLNEARPPAHARRYYRSRYYQQTPVHPADTSETP